MPNLPIQLAEPQIWAIGLACALMLMDIVTGDENREIVGEEYTEEA